ncbi:MAG: 4-(cytidine 5'-diphospho)-2-C-methyl-D-erythritol kinase [Terriglobia bacterium]
MSTSRRPPAAGRTSRSSADTPVDFVGPTHGAGWPGESLTVRSFAKVNLGLKIVGRRTDGFHELRTVFQSVDLCDRLTFTARRDSRILLKCPEIPLPLGEDNLVVAAARLLSTAAGLRRGVNILLEKGIPVGSGLGGGSSNAATTLLALNRFFKLELNPNQMLQIASALGSDVPFFLLGGRALGVGRGDELFPLSDVKATTLLLAHPTGVCISTPDAYGRASLWLTNRRPANNMARFGSEVFEKVSALGLFENDFENVLFPEYPELRHLKTALLAVGAQGAQMTGSGSAVFGIFPSISDARRAERELQSLLSASSLSTFVVRSIPRSQYLKRIFAASR